MTRMRQVVLAKRSLLNAWRHLNTRARDKADSPIPIPLETLNFKPTRQTNLSRRKQIAAKNTLIGIRIYKLHTKINNGCTNI